MAKLTFETVKQYLREHPFATNGEIKRTIDASTSTITKARIALREEGIFVKSPGDKKSEAVTELSILGDKLEIDVPTLDDPYTTASAADLIKTLGEGISLEDLTPEEAKKLLSQFGRDPQIPYNFRIAAIAQKFKLDYETQDRHALGPGKPLTEDDAIDRLSMLMQACGQKIVTASITKAFGAKKW